MESSSKETKDITGLCHIFDKTKSQESYISNQDTLTSLKVIQWQKYEIRQVFQSNLTLMVGWGWLTVYFIKSSLLIRNIYSKFCKYWTSITSVGKIMLRPWTYKILQAFSAVITFKVKLSQNKLCYSCTAFDVSCL